MAGIYKFGFPAIKDRDEAAMEALAAIRAGGDEDPILQEASIVETEDHRAAGEYLVRIVTGHPEPEPEPVMITEPGPGERRQELLAQMHAIQAELDQLGE